MNRSRRLLDRSASVLSAIIVVLVLVSAMLPPVSAQESDVQIGGPQYDGIDLVFLVDQSGSMKQNDPWQQRANTIKWVLQYLGIDNLYSRPDANHRIGIVSFGTDASTDLELTSLRVGSETEWNQTYDALQVKAVATDRTYTDVLLGLEEVKRLFDEAPPRPDGSEATRGIVILTDGAPYRDNWEGDPRYAGTNFYVPYFRDIRDFINTNLPIAPSPRSTDGYHVWVLGLNATEDAGQSTAPGTSWVDQQGYWESIVNPSSAVDRVTRINSDKNAKIPEDAVRVLDTMMVGGVCNDDASPTDKPSCIVEEEFIVPPYVARADFSVFKPQPGSEIAFFTPDGQLLDRGASNVEVKPTGEVIETISVSNPPPGRWRWQKVDASSGTATVVFQQLFAQANVLEPDGKQDLFDTSTLNIEMLDLSDRRMQDVPGYPINVSAGVVAPDGKQTDYELTSQGNGTWQATQSMLLDQPGDYKVYLTGATEDDAGKRVYVFRDLPTSFSVGNLKPNLISPLGTVPLYHQIPIAIELTKADGSQPGISPQHSVKIQAEIVSPDGNTTPIEIRTGSTANSFVAVEPITSLVPGDYAIRVQGTMEFAGKVAQLFDHSLPFTVDCIKPQITSPTDDQPQNGVTALQVEVENCRGGAYVEDPLLPWTIIASVQKPDGSARPPDTLVMVTDGLYETKLSPDTSGQWQLDTSATVEMPDGSKASAFSDIAQTFEVYPTTQIQMNVVSPQPDERQRIRNLPRIIPVPETIIGETEPAQVIAEFRDMSGRALDLEQLSADPDNAVVLMLQEPDQQGAGRPITLSVSSENPTQLVAELPDLSRSGIYKLVVAPASLNREYLPTASTPTEIEFERFDPFRIVTYVILAFEILLFALILYKLIRAFVVRLNPVRGTLEFERVGATGRGQCGTLPLSTYGKNTFEIKSDKLSALLCPEAALSLSKLKIKNASEKSGSLDEFDVSQGNDGSAIKLWAWDSSNDEIISEEPLQNNQSTFLPGPGGIVIRYRRA